eukprot:3158666-Pyramimonas_sp.AAC.1
MLVWRLCVAPLQHDMRMQLRVSSKKWEHRQRAAAARSIREGVDGDKLHRDYRILVAARGTLESGLNMRLRHLLDDSRLWLLVPQGDVTNRTRAIAFFTISSAGGS